ncbi:hypothetical protein TWF281_008422 [Arthrobotrys megalospora]
MLELQRAEHSDGRSIWSGEGLEFSTIVLEGLNHASGMAHFTSSFRSRSRKYNNIAIAVYPCYPRKQKIPFQAVEADVFGAELELRNDKTFAPIVALYNPRTKQLVWRDRIPLIYQLMYWRQKWYAVYDKKIWKAQRFHSKIFWFIVAFSRPFRPSNWGPLLYIDDLQRGDYLPTFRSLILSEFYRLVLRRQTPGPKVTIETLFEDESILNIPQT